MVSDCVVGPRQRALLVLFEDPARAAGWPDIANFCITDNEALVRMLRNALRKAIRDLQQGIEPLRPEASVGGHVATFAGDTVVRVPKASDDRALILETSRRIAQFYVAFKDLPDAKRRAAIARELAPLNRL